MRREFIEKLEQRLGRVYVQQRLGIERDHEKTFGYEIDFPIRGHYPESDSPGETLHFNPVQRETRFATQGHREYWLSAEVHPADWYSVRSLIRYSLKLAGLYARGTATRSGSRSGVTTFGWPGCLHASRGSRSYNSATYTWT
jgi:hypothetical protein